MKEALQLLEKEVFENQGINRIFVQIEKRNVNSIKFIENCGYVCE
jgi:RimJ/RimL family protein N-acetyltransferase